jgi:hypothetical protein
MTQSHIQLRLVPALAGVIHPVAGLALLWLRPKGCAGCQRLMEKLKDSKTQRLEDSNIIWQNSEAMIELPEYARVVRTLGSGTHPYRSLLPRLEESPAARRIESPTTPVGTLIDAARVRIKAHEGYCYVDVKIPAIVLSEDYYQKANPLDLYLDLVHELTHLRQLAEGENLWNHSLHYVDRPTEIEGYAVAVEEGLRLGMTEAQVMKHLSNPWLKKEEVIRLRKNIDRFLLSASTP